MSLLCHHTCLLHRNFNKFFLQRVRDGDVKSGRRKATMVLLHCDVARFGLRAVDLVLLLDHDCRKSSSPCRVAKNVPDVVVTKDQGGTEGGRRTRPFAHHKPLHYHCSMRDMETPCQREACSTGT